MSGEAGRTLLEDLRLAEKIRYFACDDKGGIGDAVIEWSDVGHRGPGWYVYCEEYPDEGSEFLSGEPEPGPELLALLQAQDERDKHMVPDERTPATGESGNPERKRTR